MIKVVDNFFNDDELNYVLNYCFNASYVYGEYDRLGLPPTGMIHQVSENAEFYNLFYNRTKRLISDLKLERIYINCFAPSENPFFHIDCSDEKAITFLYYSVDQWSPDDGGETQFYIDDEIFGVIPKPNRLVYFNSNLLHRATSFRNKHRFTVALKYKSS